MYVILNGFKEMVSQTMVCKFRLYALTQEKIKTRQHTQLVQNLIIHVDLSLVYRLPKLGMDDF